MKNGMDLPRVFFAEASPEMLEPDNLKKLQVLGFVLYKEMENGCWAVVSHAPDGNGHAVIRRKGRNHRMDLLAWVQHNGPVPDGERVYLVCGNRGCVNPDHMQLKTLTEIRQLCKGRPEGDLDIISTPLTSEQEDLICRLIRYGASKRTITLTFKITRTTFDRLRLESLGLASES